MTNEKIVARVQGNVITEGDLDRALKTLPKQALQQFTGEQGRKNLLTEMINQEVLYLDAVEKGIDKSEAFLNEINEIAKNVIKQYAVKAILSQVKVSEEEIREFYNQNPERFVSEEQVRASHILVKDEGLANELLEQIKGGVSFEEVAQQHSECPSKSQGGDLGHFGRGQMVPEFEEAAFATEVNAISDLVKTQFGYHIIKVVEKNDGQPIDFEEVRDQISNFLNTEKQNQAYYTYVSDLKNKYSITLE